MALGFKHHSPIVLALLTEQKMTQDGAREGSERQKLLSALLLDALYHRQSGGQKTTLRDLHGLLDVTQPVALRVARELEREGVAVIASNLTDAFASEISVSPRTLKEMERARQRGSSKTGRVG